MGAGPFSSDSDTRSSVRVSDSRTAASDQAAILQNRASGEGSRQAVSQATGAVSVVGGRGDITITSTSTDYGAIETASNLLGRVLDSQANVALEAIGAAGLAQGQLAGLAETKVTDGANLNQKTTIVFVVAAAVVAVLFLLLKRKA